MSETYSYVEETWEVFTVESDNLGERFALVEEALSILSEALISSGTLLIEFSDGIHSVGVSISPGTYANTAPGSGCYWARLRGFSGEGNDIIANNYSNGHQIVMIDVSDIGFETEGCGTWFRVAN